MQTLLRVSMSMCTAATVLFLLPSLGAQEMRTWTDSTGKFKVLAEMVRTEDDSVVIKKSDGKYLTMPLAKLSRADQDYVKEAAENPFAGGEKDDNPFAGGSEKPDPPEPAARPDRSSTRQRDTGNRSGGRSSRDSRSSSRGRQSAIGPEDFSDRGGPVFDTDPMPVSLRRGIEGGGGKGDTSWSCEADPGQKVEIEESPRPLSLATGEVPFGVHPKKDGLAVYTVGGKPRVLAVINLDMENKEGNSMSLVYFGDPDTGRCDCLRFVPRIKLLGVSPDGTKAIFREEPWGFGTHRGKMNFIHVVRIDGSKLSPLASYEPFSDDSDPKKMHNWDVDVEDGDWVDNDNIMLCSSKRLIVMHAGTGSVAWKMSTPGGKTRFAFSPGKKYCVLSNSSGAALVNSLTGRMIGKLDGTNRSAGTMQFAFSPDGTTIASAGSDGVMLWNATDGKAEEPFYIGSSWNSEPRWADNRFLLVGGNLVDIKTKSLVWNYSLAGIPTEETCFFGGHFWYVTSSGRKDHGLIGVRIPHSKALLASAAPESKRFCVRPGMEVTLKLDGSISDGREEIQRKMAEIIRENELVLKPDAAVTMHLKVTPEAEATTHYVTGRGFGPPVPMFGHGGGTEIKYRPSKFSIEFVQDGKTLWSVSKTTSSPSSIPLDDVQKDSLQGIVNKAMAKANGEYKAWFLAAKIPKRIPSLDGAGKSTLSSSGIRDLN